MHEHTPAVETATMHEGTAQTTHAVPVNAYPGLHERQEKVFVVIENSHVAHPVIILEQVTQTVDPLRFG